MSTLTFTTNHGAVLALIGKHGPITAREIAAKLGITERSVMRIIKDLENEAYIQRASRQSQQAQGKFAGDTAPS